MHAKPTAAAEMGFETSRPAQTSNGRAAKATGNKWQFSCIEPQGMESVALPLSNDMNERPRGPRPKARGHDGDRWCYGAWSCRLGSN
jgi:hypothetical protein